MVNIRLFREEDYEDVVQLWKDTGLILSLSDERDELLKFAKFNSESFFILEEDRIIGAVVAAYDGRRGYINHLAVHPDYQGERYGKLLMDKTMENYNSLNCVKVHLMIEKSNSKVVEYYEKMGWYIRDDLILMTTTLRS